jgi:hypothetical protein
MSICFIIYNFADKLNFKVPQKILDYEDKIKTKEIPIIFANLNSKKSLSKKKNIDTCQ